VVALAAALTACSAAGAGAESAPTPTAAATTVGPTSTGLAEIATTPPTVLAVTAAPGVPACRSSALSAHLVGQNGATGRLLLYMALTNTSAVRCAVRGYPGISLLDAANNELGAPADRLPAGAWSFLPGAKGGTVVLGKGDAASFTVLRENPGNVDGCLTPAEATTAATMRIFPPDNTVPLLVPLTNGSGLTACTKASIHELQVTTVGAP
jgi:hypothetical protein